MLADLPVFEARSVAVVLAESLPVVQQLRLADFMEEVLGCTRLVYDLRAFSCFED